MDSFGAIIYLKRTNNQLKREYIQLLKDEINKIYEQNGFHETVPPQNSQPIFRLTGFGFLVLILYFQYIFVISAPPIVQIFTVLFCRVFYIVTAIFFVIYVIYNVLIHPIVDKIMKSCFNGLDKEIHELEELRFALFLVDARKLHLKE